MEGHYFATCKIGVFPSVHRCRPRTSGSRGPVQCLLSSRRSAASVFSALPSCTWCQRPPCALLFQPREIGGPPPALTLGESPGRAAARPQSPPFPRGLHRCLGSQGALQSVCVVKEFIKQPLQPSFPMWAGWGGGRAAMTSTTFIFLAVKNLDSKKIETKPQNK